MEEAQKFLDGTLPPSEVDLLALAVTELYEMIIGGAN